MRRYGQLTYEAQKVTAMLNKEWKFLRAYPLFLSKIYKRVCVIAIKRGIDLPRPHTDMEVEDKTWRFNND